MKKIKFKKIKNKKIICLIVFILLIIIGVICFLITNNNISTTSSKKSKDSKDEIEIKEVVSDTDEEIEDEEEDEVEEDSVQEKTESNNKTSTSKTSSENKTTTITNNASTTTKTNTTTDTSKKNTTKTETISATKSYYCLSGWTLNGDQCSITYSYAAYKQYSCSTGTLSGTSCVTDVKKYVYYTTASSEYCTAKGLKGSGSYNSCRCTQSGGQYVENGNCYINTTSSIPANVTYSCSGSFELQGTTCVSTTTGSAMIKYTCPDGYTLSGDKCKK